MGATAQHFGSELPRWPSCAAHGEPFGQAPISRPLGTTGLGIAMLLSPGILKCQSVSQSCAHRTPSPVSDPWTKSQTHPFAFHPRRYASWEGGMWLTCYPQQ